MLNGNFSYWTITWEIFFFGIILGIFQNKHKWHSLKVSLVCLSWPLTQLLNGNLRNLIFYGKSGCITPEQKKCKKNICARGNSHIFIIERKVNEGHTDRHGSALMTPNVGKRICIPILSITADYFSYIFSKYCNVFQVTVTSKIHTITWKWQPNYNLIMYYFDSIYF